MTLRTLILRYAFFAVLATLANLAAQRAALSLVTGTAGYVLAVCAGTGVGLVLKYVLDKRWIFHDFSTGLSAHGRRFALYTGTGVLTTLIFWGAETACWLIWQTGTMREVGAVGGLAVGYVLKYRFDRHFVFSDARLRPEGAP